MDFGKTGIATQRQLSLQSIVTLSSFGAAIAPIVLIRLSALFTGEISPVAVEIRDQLVVVTWWLGAIFLALVAIGVGGVSLHRFLDRISSPAAFVASLLLVFSLLTTNDESGTWSGLSLIDFFRALAICAAVIIAVREYHGFGKFLIIPAFFATVISGIFVLLQNPAGVNDTFHFGFSSEELMSAGAGRYPLVDFVSQYTNLLPYLFAPAFSIFPGHPVEIVLVGIFLMQVLAVIAVAVLCFYSTRKIEFALLGVIFSLGPVLASSATGYSSGWYFQNFPIRFVFPLLTIVFLGKMFTRWKDAPPFGVFVLGILAGTTALNNPEFGIPLLLVIGVVLTLASQDWKKIFQTLGYFVLGNIFLVCGVLILFPLFFGNLDWSFYLAFLRAFGVDLFGAVAMRDAGFHIIAASLFIITSVIGFQLIVINRKNAVSPQGDRYLVQGIIMAAFGGWSLLSLVYASGRSLPPTYISGFGFQAGACVALILPLYMESLKTTALRVVSPLGWMPGLVLFASISSFLIFMPTSASVSAKTSPYIVTSLERLDLSAEDLSKLGPLDRAGSILPMANAVSLTYGIPSIATQSDNNYLYGSFDLKEIQCRHLVKEGNDRVLVSGPVLASFKTSKVCKGWLEDRTVTSLGNEIYLVGSEDDGAK